MRHKLRLHCEKEMSRAESATACLANVRKRAGPTMLRLFRSRGLRKICQREPGAGRLLPGEEDERIQPTEENRREESSLLFFSRDALWWAGGKDARGKEGRDDDGYCKDLGRGKRGVCQHVACEEESSREKRQTNRKLDDEPPLPGSSLG